MLRSRLAELEEQVSRMSKTMVPSPAGCGEPEPDETELFQRCTDQAKVTSLSSHISAVRKTLPISSGTVEQQSPPSQMKAQYGDRVAPKHLLALPAQSELQSLVDLYFEYMNYFFPCVDEGEFRAQLALACTGRVNHGRSLQETAMSMSSTFLMLLYVVLAIGTCLDPQSQKSPSNTVARRRYLETAYEISRGRQESGNGEANMELVRYQTALAVCLIHIERPTSAYRAVSDAIQQAFVCGLNDESLWSCLTEREARSRRLLWWTVFYLDRRIAQKCWKPYLVRETDIYVDESMGFLVDATNAAVIDVDVPLRAEQSELVDQYALSNIRWAKLWAVMWDTLFSVRAVRTGATAEDLEVLDARILHAQRQVPPSLQWDTSFAETYAAAAEAEVHTRSRLVVYVVSLLQSSNSPPAFGRGFSLLMFISVSTFCDCSSASRGVKHRLRMLVGLSCASSWQATRSMLS